MIRLGLSAADQRTYEASLGQSHAIRVRVMLLDLNHRLVGEASGKVLSGQVDFDAAGEVTRSARLEIYDPENDLGVDLGTPTAAGFFADRMIQVWYGVWSDGLNRWVDAPVFTGPITTLSRDGSTLSLEAHGKESLMLTAGCRSLNFPKGTPKTSIMRQIFAAAGETFLELPTLPDRSTTATVVASVEPLWPRLQGWARSLGLVLAYDGRGYATLRQRPKTPVWTFRGGDGGTLLSDPSIAYKTDSLINLVVVTGGTPKGAKKRITAQAVAPASHPLSGARIGRGSQPRYLRFDVNDDSITTQAAANALAKAKLSEGMQAGVDVAFDAIPVPHLEPGDLVRVNADTWEWTSVVQTATLPLTEGSPMSIGYAFSTRSLRR